MTFNVMRDMDDSQQQQATVRRPAGHEVRHDLVRPGSSDRSGSQEDRTGQDIRRREELDALLTVIRPVMQADGGDLDLVDVDTDTGVVHVRLTGACGSCAVSSVTLSAGVARILRQRLDWVTDVVGDVAESDDQGFGSWVPADGRG